MAAWQQETQFIAVTTVATAAQRPGRQCGGSRTAVQVLWRSWGSGDVAAAPTVQQPLGTWLTAAPNGDCGTGSRGSHRFFPPVPQRWPSWHLREELFPGICYAILICKRSCHVRPERFQSRLAFTPYLTVKFFSEVIPQQFSVNCLW